MATRWVVATAQQGDDLARRVALSKLPQAFPLDAHLRVIARHQPVPVGITWPFRVAIRRGLPQDFERLEKIGRGSEVPVPGIKALFAHATGPVPHDQNSSAVLGRRRLSAVLGGEDSHWSWDSG